jgi:hypothetical protein
VTDRYSVTSYITNGFLFVCGWLSQVDPLMLIGTMLAIATFGTNHYFKRKQDRRDDEAAVLLKERAVREDEEAARRKELHDLKIATYEATIAVSRDSLSS